MQLIDIDAFIKKHITKRRDSLLAADLKKYDAELASRIDGKSIIVIGGAGTIGSSFVKAALKFKPRRMYVVDTNENGLTELVRDLRSSTEYNIPDDFKTYPIDFGAPVFEKMLKLEGPFEIIANFAAHKHVRSEKDHYSIQAMVENNVIKAKKLLDLLLEMPPERYFSVSTDKAANPVNVMGASKKLMEEVLLAYSRKIPISTARFANVAFSNGSLLFGFIQRMMKRQPLSSPSDVKRYFVSPEESGQLCLIACVMGDTGEIFFPKLTEDQMIFFNDIADDFLREQGLEPLVTNSEEEARSKARQFDYSQKEYPVFYFPSNTSGEKLYEEFFVEGEQLEMDKFKQLGIIQNNPAKSIEEMAGVIADLEQLFKDQSLNKSSLVEQLKQIIPNFHHIETGKNLDSKM